MPDQASIDKEALKTVRLMIKPDDPFALLAFSGMMEDQTCELTVRLKDLVGTWRLNQIRMYADSLVLTFEAE